MKDATCALIDEPGSVKEDECLSITRRTLQAQDLTLKTWVPHSSLKRSPSPKLKCCSQTFLRPRGTSIVHKRLLTL